MYAKKTCLGEKMPYVIKPTKRPTAAATSEIAKAAVIILYALESLLLAANMARNHVPGRNLFKFGVYVLA